jgi:hypothetical protein
MGGVWYWFANNWKWFAPVAGFIALLGGALMWFPRYRKAQADAASAVLDLAQAQRDLQDRGIAQKIGICADAMQAAYVKHGGKGKYAFSEQELRDMLTDQQQLRLHAALELMRNDGRARRANPGSWFIN